MNERKIDAEKLAKEAELFKLRQQLQPHFLFNSLNSINALIGSRPEEARKMVPVSYTHLRAHETVLDLVCRLLLEKKQKNKKQKEKKKKTRQQHNRYNNIGSNTKPQ